MSWPPTNEPWRPGPRTRNAAIVAGYAIASQSCARLLMHIGGWRRFRAGIYRSAFVATAEMATKPVRRLIVVLGHLDEIGEVRKAASQPTPDCAPLRVRGLLGLLS